MPVPQQKTTGFDVAATGTLGLTQALESDRQRFEADRAFKESQRLSDAEILHNTRNLLENARQFNLSLEQQNELAQIEAQLRADLQGAQLATEIGEGARQRAATEKIAAREDVTRNRDITETAKTQRYDISERTKIARQQADLEAQRMRQQAQTRQNLEDMVLSYDWSDSIEKEYIGSDGRPYLAKKPLRETDQPTGNQRYTSAHELRIRDLASRILGGTGEYAGAYPTVTQEAQTQARSIAEDLYKNIDAIKQKHIDDVMAYESAAATGRASEAIAIGQAGYGRSGTSGQSAYGYGSSIPGQPRQDWIPTFVNDDDLYQRQITELGIDSFNAKQFSTLSRESRDLIFQNSTSNERSVFQRMEDRLQNLQTSAIGAIQQGGTVSDANLQEAKSDLIDMIDTSSAWTDTPQIKTAIKDHISNSIDNTRFRIQLGLPVAGTDIYTQQLKDAESKLAVSAAQLAASQRQVQELQSRLSSGTQPPVEQLQTEAQSNPDAVIDLFYLGNQERVIIR